MASIHPIDRPSGTRSFKVVWRDPAAKWRSKTFSGDGASTRARAFRSKIEVQVRDGSYRDPKLGRQAFEVFLDASLDVRPMNRQKGDRRLKPKTLESYRSFARKITQGKGEAARELAERPISRVDGAVLEAFFGELEESNGPAVVHAVYRLVRRTLELAIERGLAPAPNPCGRIQVAKADRHEMRFLSADELAALSEAVSPSYRALVLVLGYCGLRWGEASALQRRHVDVLRGRILIEQSYSETGAGLVLNATPKGGRARPVRIPRTVADALAKHLQDFVSSDAPDAAVFTTLNGKPLRNSNFRDHVWLPALGYDLVGKELRLTRPLLADPQPRIHDLRHTAAALAIAAGYHTKQVQEMLGHSSIAVTIDVYGHLTETLQDQAVDRLDAIARAAKPASSADVVAISSAR